MLKYYNLLKKIFLQIVFPLAIWARNQEGDIILDKDGKPVPQKVATFVARLASLSLTAFAVKELFGIPVEKIIEIFLTISQYF